MPYLTADAGAFLAKRADVQLKIDAAVLEGKSTAELRRELRRIDREEERQQVRMQVTATEQQRAARRRGGQVPG